MENSKNLKVNNLPGATFLYILCVPTTCFTRKLNFWRKLPPKYWTFFSSRMFVIYFLQCCALFGNIKHLYGLSEMSGDYFFAWLDDFPSLHMIYIPNGKRISFLFQFEPERVCQWGDWGKKYNLNLNLNLSTSNSNSTTTCSQYCVKKQFVKKSVAGASRREVEIGSFILIWLK
jgi:hypothetical protein